jgi:hypothetical protein
MVDDVMDKILRAIVLFVGKTTIPAEIAARKASPTTAQSCVGGKPQAQSGLRELACKLEENRSVVTG